MSTIHVVEDDPFLAEIYVGRLESDGFKVILSRDGEEGLQAALREKPDAILLDLVLPERDGFSVLEQLRRDKTTKDLPVLILSNLGERKDIARAMELGATDYIIKAHFTPSEVVAKLKEFLKKKK